MDAIDRLYGLPLGGFVAARNELAATLKRSGQRERAEQVRKLRKPSITAWLLNQMQRRRPDILAALREAGHRLLVAQREGRGDAVAAAGAELREAVARVMEEAASVAAAAGEALSPLQRDRLEASVRALAAWGRRDPPEPPGRWTAEIEPPPLDLLLEPGAVRSGNREPEASEQRGEAPAGGAGGRARGEGAVTPGARAAPAGGAGRRARGEGAATPGARAAPAGAAGRRARGEGTARPGARAAPAARDEAPEGGGSGRGSGRDDERGREAPAAGAEVPEGRSRPGDEGGEASEHPPPAARDGGSEERWPAARSASRSSGGEARPAPEADRGPGRSTGAEGRPAARSAGRSPGGEARPAPEADRGPGRSKGAEGRPAARSAGRSSGGEERPAPEADRGPGRSTRERHAGEAAAEPTSERERRRAAALREEHEAHVRWLQLRVARLETERQHALEARQTAEADADRFRSEAEALQAQAERLWTEAEAAAVRCAEEAERLQELDRDLDQARAQLAAVIGR